MNNKRYHKLIIKEIFGDIETSDKHLLEEWLAKSVENKIEYEKFKAIWMNTAPSEIPKISDIETEWTALNNRIKSVENIHETKESIRSKINFSIQSIFITKWKPALGSALVIFILAVSIFLFNRENSVNKTIVITTANQESRSVQLSDGSTVYLNSGSQIETLEKFDEHIRRVNLKGEAFFSISKEQRPFIITTDNAKITVLGTKFDVYARYENTRVFVKEGKVNFSRKNIDASKVDLSTGQLSTINKDAPPSLPVRVDTEYLLGWMDGKLVFNKTPLGEIVNEMERYYNIKITLENDSLKTYTLTGSFKNYTIDTVLSMICLALEIDYEKQSEGYLIKEKNMNQ